MKRLFLTAVIIIAAVCAMPCISVYAAKPDLTVEYSADDSGVTLSWHADGKNVITESTVYKYDGESKNFLRLARTNKTDYTDSGARLTAGETARYKVIAALKNGGKISKTVSCYTELSDIPLPFRNLGDGSVCRAYVYDDKANENGVRPIIYHNCFGDKIIGETGKDKGVNEFSASESGRVVFYIIGGDVYRYCDNGGKPELIFRRDEKFTDIITSPSGECCAFFNSFECSEAVFVWYEGKVFSVMPKEDEPYYIEAVLDDGRVVYSATYDNYDEDIYYYCLYEFDSKTAKNKRFAKLECSENYIYATDIFPEAGTYALYNEDFGYYCGEIGSKPRPLLSSDECFFDFYNGIFDTNGKITVTNDEKYIYSIDHESGKKSVITKFLKESYYDYIKFSGDLSAAVYIDYDRNILVRLSKWDGEKCEYAKKQEIPIGISEDLHIADASNNLNIVYLWGDNHLSAAFFQTGKIEAANNILGSDAYDRMFCYESKEKIYDLYDQYKNLMILNPDGSTTVVYDGYFNSTEFGSSELLRIYLTKYLFDEEYNLYYCASDDIYFINKNEEAVFWRNESYEHVVTP